MYKYDVYGDEGLEASRDVGTKMLLDVPSAPNVNRFRKNRLNGIDE